jgi:hypothetical protein
MKLLGRKLIAGAFIATLATAASVPARADFITYRQDANGTGGISQILNMTDAESVLAPGGGSPHGSVTTPYVAFLGDPFYAAYFPSLGTAFPGGTLNMESGDDFATRSVGYVTGLSGPGTFTLGVRSDDGFRVYVNANLVLSFENGRPVDDTTGAVTLNNGDKLQIDYFDGKWGEMVEFFRDFGGGNRALVGALESGIGIGTVPEPSTLALWSLFGMVGGFVAWRKRKN